MNINLLKSLIISIIFFISINYDLQAQLKSHDNQADYIVITSSQFDEALQPFVEWRQ